MQRIQTWLWGGLFLLLLFTAVFFGYIGQDRVLLTTDAAIGYANASWDEVLRSVLPAWGDKVLLGGPNGGPSTQVAWLLLAVLPGILWNNVAYGLACLLGAAVLLWWLRKQCLCISAALLAGITACWLGSNFSLLYPGHGHKPYVILFFLLALIPTEQAAKGRLTSGLLWGSCVGLMFVQQPDVAFFFALFSGAYLVFRLWSAQGLRPLLWLKVLLPALALALLFAAGPLLSGYKYNVKDAAPVQAESAQAKWGYMTQWSFPPDEMIDFIAPGYTGWRSGEPDGPYWGRMGRSPGWEQTHQGYINFKLESVYLGFIPLAFALFALFSVLARGKYGSKGVKEYGGKSTRAEIIFWGCVSVIALLLAFGKFFPLYSLFYQLPIVNNIRNPNKFLQVFQVALAILAAYGVNTLFEARSQKSEGRSQKAACGEHSRTEVRGFFWVVAVALGVLGLWALGQTLGRPEDVARFVAFGWPPEVAGVMVQNKANALWYALLMAAVTAAIFAIYSFNWLQKLRRYGTGLAIGLVLLVAADAIKLSKHYVQPMPRSYIQANALTDFLKNNIGVQRVALLTQQSVYNIWLTYLLPFNRIPAFNFSQMPRMANDYKNFMAAGSKDPLRMWHFAAVKYLLGPASFEKQFPAGQVKKVFAYNLAAAPDNEFQVIPDSNGAHAVFELLDTVPRYALVARFEPASDEQALARIAGNGPLLSGQGQTGTVEVIRYRPGRVELKTQSDAPAMLRVAERWDPDWKAEVDGQPAAVQRIDYLCQGVTLSAGVHDVILTYSPSRLFFYMQCAGCLVLLAALFLKRSA